MTDENQGGDVHQAIQNLHQQIPEDAFWDQTSVAFVSDDGTHISQEFFDQWQHRRDEFPLYQPPARRPVFLKPIEEIGSEENGRVQETIRSDRMRQLALMEELRRQIGEDDEAITRLTLRQSEIAGQVMERTGHRAELRKQVDEALHRIELYGRMLLEADMAEMRRG